MDLIQLQMRKTFYDISKSKKSLACADNYYGFLLMLQSLRDDKLLTGVKTNDVTYEIWSHLIHGKYPASNMIICKKDFETKLLEAIDKK